MTESNSNGDTNQNDDENDENDEEMLLNEIFKATSNFTVKQATKDASLELQALEDNPEMDFSAIGWQVNAIPLSYHYHTTTIPLPYHYHTTTIPYQPQPLV